ncbi:MAG: hypothetical protein AAFV59_04145 [Pseudomonadota bacterium]
MKNVGFIFVFLCLVGCASGSVNSNSLQEEGYGAVMYRQTPPATPESVGLFLAEFDEADGSIGVIDTPWSDRRLNKWESIWDTEQHYQLAWLKPGLYVVRSFHQQDKWQLCFHEDAVVFEITAGEVSYLGQLDVSEFTMALQLNVMKEDGGDLVKFGSETSSYYFDGVPRLEFSAPSKNELVRVDGFIARQPATTQMSTKSADVERHPFQTKTYLTGGRRCN